jgi:hypothetical protein
MAKIEPMSLEKYNDLIDRARKAVFVHNATVLSLSLAEGIVDAVIAGAGLVGPAPELHPETECSALLWDSRGGAWQVCDDDPDHPGDHDNSEWTWHDSDDNAISAQEVRSWE